MTTPTGNLCTKCVPELRTGPSGLRLRHRWDCPEKPGEPINVKDYAKGRSGEPWKRRW
jgi:hypothetical protein